MKAKDKIKQTHENQFIYFQSPLKEGSYPLQPMTLL